MKTIVITGASRGIGLATAQKFLTEGWRVIGTYLNTSIPIADPNLVSVHYDQADPASIAKAAEEIEKAVPQIDALVNNAGIILDAMDESADMQKIRETLEVDLIGVIDLTERMMPLMAPGGHVVNMDSLYGRFSYPIDDGTSIGYRLAKAALNMYTRILAFRVKDKGVVVSSLDPGWVKTDMGALAATETEKPDREPSEPAEEIYQIITTAKESGYIWKEGKRVSW